MRQNLEAFAAKQQNKKSLEKRFGKMYQKDQEYVRAKDYKIQRMTRQNEWLSKYKPEDEKKYQTNLTRISSAQNKQALVKEDMDYFRPYYVKPTLRRTYNSMDQFK